MFRHVDLELPRRECLQVAKQELLVGFAVVKYAVKIFLSAGQGL